MSRNVAVLRTDRLSTRCSLVMLTVLWDQVHRACSIVQTKQKHSENLVTAIPLPFYFVHLEEGAQLGPVKMLTPPPRSLKG